MKFVVALLLIALIVLAGILRMQSTKIGDLQRQIHDLNAKLVEKSKADTLDLQEKCAKQAHETFKLNGWEDKDKKDKNGIALFSNHYNQKLDKCFVQSEDNGSTLAHAPGIFFNSKVVSDAFEGKVYAQYMWHSEKDKKHWEVPPFLCEVTLPSGEKKICHSDDEFTELGKVYMEGN